MQEHFGFLVNYQLSGKQADCFDLIHKNRTGFQVKLPFSFNFSPFRILLISLDTLFRYWWSIGPLARSFTFL